MMRRCDDETTPHRPREQQTPPISLLKLSIPARAAARGRGRQCWPVSVLAGRHHFSSQGPGPARAPPEPPSMPAGGGGSDRQREERLLREAAQRLWTEEGDGEAADDPSSPAVAGPAGQASYVRLAAGRGSPPRGRGTTTRRGAAGGAASSSHGGAAWRAEDTGDRVSRGVTGDSAVPYVEEVLAVAHSHR